MASIAMAETVPDLSKTDEATFKANIGKTVSIEGKLTNGKIGCSVWTGIHNVSFRVVPDVPPGGFAYPKAWMDLIGQQVRVTGELKFKRFDHNLDRPGYQSALDYYFMVLQKTKIEKVATPSPIAEPDGGANRRGTVGPKSDSKPAGGTP